MILVINCGSSSLKFQLFNTQALRDSDAKNSSSIATGIIEQIGQAEGVATLKYGDSKVSKNRTFKNHSEAFSELKTLLLDAKLIDDFKDLDGIGHRVVHGGEIFKEPTLIDLEVIKKIEELSPLAPLHNPANLIGIEESIKIAPNTPQVAIFDTAFHQSLEKSAYIYPLPFEWYERHKVRRYGFHGTSHKFVSSRCAEFLNKNIDELNLITLHLGNGASASAIEKGRCIDTSMGLTPLEGLVMGTRCGDIDSAILFFMNSQCGFDFKELDTILNKKSGLKGICGDNDLRDILERIENRDEMAILAFDILCRSIKKYIGSYSVLLGHVDGIIFTGGIGENAAILRERVCENLDRSIGAEIDLDRNKRVEEGLISTENSRIKIFVIATNEELEIATLTLKLINRSF